MSLLNKRAIGVEIDDQEIRVVELCKKIDGRVNLSKYDRIPLPPNAVEDGFIVNSIEVSNCIKELWDNNGFRKKNIVIGISNQDVMIRRIQLPDLPKDKLDPLISNHAQEYMPISLENSVLDYMIVGRREVEGVKNVEILLAAARLSMIQEFYDCFNDQGLKIKDITVSSLSLLNSMDKEEIEGVVVLVDISNTMGNLVICVDGHAKLVRMLRVNFTQSTGLIPSSSSFKMELMEIVLSTWTQILYNEIRSSIQYFQSQEDTMEINKIILSGCGSRIKDLDVELHKNLGITMEYINPVQKIARVSQAYDESLLDYTTCIGLAFAGLE